MTEEDLIIRSHILNLMCQFETSWAEPKYYFKEIPEVIEQLKEMDEINSEFANASVAVVVGANDVVNPAAQTTPGCPIYGMPILEVNNAANIIFLKRSMRPGFAGIENELLYDPKTMLLFGDAKASLTKVVSALKAL